MLHITAVVGVVSGLIGILLAIPVTSSHMEKLHCRCGPSRGVGGSWLCHHVQDWWGLHEDMHFFMIVSDIAFFCLCYKALSNETAPM